MRGSARVVANYRGGRTVLDVLEACSPLAVFPTYQSIGQGAVVTLVSAAGGMVEGDIVTVDIVVGDGAELSVGAVGATIALDGGELGSATTTTATVGTGATLRWQAEPLIVTARSRHKAMTRIDLAQGSTLRWADSLVLGRTDEAPGACSTDLKVDLAGHPLLRNQVCLGPASGWSSPVAMGSYRRLFTTLLVGDAVGEAAGMATSPYVAVMELEAGGTIVSRVG